MTDNKVIEAPFTDAAAETPVSGGRKKPCIALMGEFSAGKTTLINFLIGRDVLPTKVTATQVPPVWLSHGDGASYYVDNDYAEHPLNLSDIQDLAVENVRYIKMFSSSDILTSFDLIDTPGISDPNIPEYHRNTAIDNADAAIWCTHATQAWRASEKSTWDEMPEKWRKHSILLATRADKLDDHNRGRVKKRLMRETGDVFGSIIMFSATDALTAKAGEGPDDLMVHCGGAELLEVLERVAGDIGAGAGMTRDNDQDADAASHLRPVRPTRVARKGGSEQAHDLDDKATDEVARAQSTKEPVAEVVEETGALLLKEDYRYAGDADSDALTVEAGHGGDDDGAVVALPADDDNDEFDTEIFAPKSASKTSDYDGEDEFEDEEGEDVSAINDSILARLSPIEGSGPDAGAEDDVTRALAEVERADAADEQPASPADAGSGTVRKLWEQILAEQKVETIEDVLEAIGRYIDTLDKLGAFSEVYVRASTATDSADENSGWRRTS